MIVSLNVSMWTARKFDKSASKQTTSSYGASESAARVNKLLIPKDALAAVTKAGTAMRAEYLKMTLPWNDNNQRLLSGALYMEFTDTMRNLARTFDQAADELCRDYAVLVADAEVQLNGLFNPQDYPDQDTVREKFSTKIDFMPVPDSGHLLVDIGNEETVALKGQIDEAVNSSLAKAQTDTWDRLYGVVSHMAERLDDTDAVFRDSLVENIQNLCALLPSLNITGDKRLYDLQQEVEARLLSYTPKELRKSKLIRSDTAEAAKDIMEKMAAYMG